MAYGTRTMCITRDLPSAKGFVTSACILIENNKI